MCTVTLIARQAGYALGMNRDEKLARVSALPPQKVRLRNCEALFPSEPAGGTWAGVNSFGITLALINWYSARDYVQGKVVSRGDIVRNLLAGDSLETIAGSLSRQPLEAVNPFRLIGVFPEKRVVEWQWNLNRLETHEHSWRTHVWISSGFDEPGAQHVRGIIFAKALRDPDAETLPWLRRLHASHSPKAGPYSICMHRDDAATVSYTEIEMNARTAALRYAACAPCNEAAIRSNNSPAAVEELQLSDCSNALCVSGA